MESKKNKMAKSENPMRRIEIDKVILGVGATGDTLEKGVKLLKMLTNRTPSKRKSNKRIPSLGVRPGLYVGAIVTIRKDYEEILRKILSGMDNTVKRKQVAENGFSFGVKEYIDIPGVEYQREIGILGFDVTIVFKRYGRRIKLRKTKKGKIPQRQKISPEEIIRYMEERFNTKFV